MTTHVTEPLIAIGASTMVGMGLIEATPPGAQEWTVLGLLAFVVAGIGTWIVKSIDKTTGAIEKNTAAQSTVAEKLALLMHETTQARHDGEEKRRQILAGLAELKDLPDQVADRIRQKRTA